jgi:hypothetical protein
MLVNCATLIVSCGLVLVGVVDCFGRRHLDLGHEEVYINSDQLANVSNSVTAPVYFTTTYFDPAIALCMGSVQEIATIGTNICLRVISNSGSVVFNSMMYVYNSDTTIMAQSFFVDDLCHIEILHMSNITVVDVAEAGGLDCCMGSLQFSVSLQYALPNLDGTITRSDGLFSAKIRF